MGFNCYIDESGDEGINTGGTRWFILGALIVPDHLDLQTSTMVRRIKKRFGKPDSWNLRWSNIRNHDKKLFICQELLTEQWVFSCVATDKEHPTVRSAAGLRGKWALYFYSTRLLLEWLSWYARDHGGQRASLIFENRSNMSYDAMKEYLRLLRGWMPPTEISWANLNWKDFDTISKGRNRLLQAVDQLCGALSDALEYSPYGNIEPRYVFSLRERFYRRNGNLFSYGLKFLPTDAKLNDLKAEYKWLESI